MKIIGQKRVQETLSIIIKASESHSRVLRPILLTGPAGYGKTTLAKDIAKKLGKELVQLNGVAVKDMKNFAVSIYKMTSDQVMFIDEIHSLDKELQEILYTVLEENKLTIPKECICVNTKPFTFIGATTDEGKLLKPMFSRFTYKLKLEEYSKSELSDIVIDRYPPLRSLGPDIAKACRGCPRTLIAICDWTQDFFTAKKLQISQPQFFEALNMLGVTKNGYSRTDIRYLQYLFSVEKPVGLKTLCSFLSESEYNVENVVEPFLIKEEMIFKTNTGRCLTPKAHGLLKAYFNDKSNSVLQ